MEVHHHGHVHHRSKWKDYLFQFLMLFIAVFCGFLAEYQLEHYIEKERAKELAKTLYEELKSDSINLQQVQDNRLEKEGHLRYVYSYIKDSNLSVLPREFYPHYVWSFFAVSYILFEPKDGMLEQLKNSGSLRYFRDIELQKAIGDHSVALNNLRTRLERESTIMLSRNTDFVLKHLDFTWIDQVSDKGKLSVFNSLRQYEKSDRFIEASVKNLSSLEKETTCNLILFELQVFAGTRKNQIKAYVETQSQLMSILRKKYRL